MTEQEWIDSIVGKPYVELTDGPDTFDCFGVVLDYIRKVNGQEVELSGYKDGRSFAELLTIADGFTRDDNGVLFCCFHNETPFHCGVKIGDRVIHAWGKNQGGQVYNDSLKKFTRAFKDSRLYTYG